MGTCKGIGIKIKKKGRRGQRRGELDPEKRRPIKGLRMKSDTWPNNHRLFPVKAKGFNPNSLQMRAEIPGIHKRYIVDKNGTITNMDN